MNEASSLASHRIGQAISCGVAQRPSSDVVWRSVLSVSTLLPAALAFEMEVGQRRAGTDRVDAYAVRHFLEGERARQGEDAGLGRVVEAHALAAGQRIARGDVDDTGATAVAQRRQRRLAVVGGANEIDADHGLPLGGG